MTILDAILKEKTDDDLARECEFHAERVRSLSEGLTKEQIDEAWGAVFKKLYGESAGADTE